MPPVGTISLERHRDDLLAFMNAHLPDTPHRAWLLDVVSAADYSGYGRFFATVAAALFREWGVVFIDALEIRRFTAPYLAAAVARIGDVENALRRGGLDLKQAGFEPLSDAGLFEIRQDAVAARIRCAVDTGGRLETSRGRLPPEAVAEWIREEPERFSAGAALRPVLQDGVLPVGITVCGPTEMLYLWQTGPVYRELGVSRSQLHPRIHATVLPPQARRIIDKLGGLETAMNRRPPGDHDIPVADMQDLEMLRDELLRRLESAEDADPKQVSRAVDSIRHQVSRVIDSMMKTRSERLGSRRRQQERFDIMALPGGKPQERIVSLFELLAEWGPEWPEWIRDGLSVLETAHRCIIMNG